MVSSFFRFEEVEGNAASFFVVKKRGNVLYFELLRQMGYKMALGSASWMVTNFHFKILPNFHFKIIPNFHLRILLNFHLIMIPISTPKFHQISISEWYQNFHSTLPPKISKHHIPFLQRSTQASIPKKSNLRSLLEVATAYSVTRIKYRLVSSKSATF